MRKSAETCIFCAPDPCVCHPKKPEARKAARRATPPVGGETRTDAPVLQDNLGGANCSGDLTGDRTVRNNGAREGREAPPPRHGIAGAKLGSFGRQAQPRPPTQRPALESLPRPIEDEQDEYRRALTLLCASGLVGSESILEHVADLNLTESEKRRLIWRQKRAENDYRIQDAAG